MVVWDLLAVFGVLGVAAVLGLRGLRSSRWGHKTSGALFASAMMFGLGNVFGGGKPEIIQESKREANRKKDAQSADPPTPDTAENPDDSA